MCPNTLTQCDRPRSDREIRLEPTVRAPSEAREFVRRQLTELGYPGSVGDSEIVVSELVTNAVAAAPDGTIFVALRIAAGYPLLEVWDQSPDEPVLKEPDYIAESGRGLHIVKELSVLFDWQLSGRWKVVWALLERG